MLLNALYRCSSERLPDCPVLAEPGLEPQVFFPPNPKFLLLCLESRKEQDTPSWGLEGAASWPGWRPRR